MEMNPAPIETDIGPPGPPLLYLHVTGWDGYQQGRRKSHMSCPDNMHSHRLTGPRSDQPVLKYRLRRPRSLYIYCKCFNNFTSVGSSSGNQRNSTLFIALFQFRLKGTAPEPI